MAKKQKRAAKSAKPVRGKTTSAKKMSHEDFVKKGIVKLRVKKDQGIHVVYSGFNQAFREYFNGEDPRPHLDRLAEQGVITVRPAKGGATIALSDGKPHVATGVLDKILAA